MKTTTKELKYTQYTIVKNEDILKAKSLLQEIRDMIVYNELDHTINFKLYDASYYLYDHYYDTDSIEIFDSFCTWYYDLFIYEVDHLDIKLIQLGRTSSNYVAPGKALYYEDYAYYLEDISESEILEELTYNKYLPEDLKDDIEKLKEVIEYKKIYNDFINNQVENLKYYIKEEEDYHNEDLKNLVEDITFDDLISNYVMRTNNAYTNKDQYMKLLKEKFKKELKY